MRMRNNLDNITVKVVAIHGSILVSNFIYSHCRLEKCSKVKCRLKPVKAHTLQQFKR